MLAVELQLENAGMLARLIPAALIGSRMQQPAQQQQQQAMCVKAAARQQSGTTSGTSSSICGGRGLVIKIWSSS
jgi:hypothetical protein